MSDRIVVKGAREHNLHNISVEMPRDAFVVMTGLSGSGKSSLAFDTIYAEGQRRYVESLSSYARMFLGRMDKPDVDAIEGLSPAISIEQKTTHSNPRSTVGTVTEIYDYLRLLYARIGVPYCPSCGKEITSQSIDQIVSEILLRESGKIMVLAPIARGAKGEYKKEFAKMIQEGFVRARVDGEVVEISEGMSLKKTFKHTIEIVVDRIVLRDTVKSRLSESVETALKYGDGLVVIHDVDKGEDTTYSEKHACPDCGFTIDEIEPRLFSFNNPFGACPECTGLGSRMEFDPELVIPDRSLSLNQDAIRTIGSMQGSWITTQLRALSEAFGFSLDEPVSSMSKEALDVLLFGSKGREFHYVYSGKQGKSRYEFTGRFEGLIPNLERRYHETKSEGMREWMEKFMRQQPCNTCHGQRLKPAALAVRVGGKNIIELTSLDVGASLAFFDALELDPRRAAIAKQIIKEIRERLGFMLDVGLDYLSLDRMAGTLSGGEAQRIRLATQIGSSLMGVLYVLDEPTIGLHQRDNDRLLATLRRLQQLGNTLVVVEHDEQTIRQADWLIDLGPGAGEHGGNVIFSGPPDGILDNPHSLTGQYLSGRLSIGVPATRRPGNGLFLVVRGARENNLKSIDVSFPLGCLVAVTGVSGSGKSSLVSEVLSKGVAHALGLEREIPGKHDRIEGLEHIDKLINIDQSPIGRTPRSNPATYTGLFTPIRDLFASLPEAKARGFAPGRFSFNVKGGRCETCEGAGVLKIEMHFLPDVYVTCDVCHGRRYNSETLEVRYKGKNIHEVLDMTIEEALDFFNAFPAMNSKLQTLVDVGLGYVRLGQPATTLSGGEAQRVKLATWLSRRSTGKTLYVLDEPTTGLHFDDVRRLLAVLERFADAGDSVIVIEHNLDVIKRSDWLIDMGPEGGRRGGIVVASGTPETVAASTESHTGRYLAPLLGTAASAPKKKSSTRSRG
ncbi:MAG TPA: excinuclease ABC subunit UvrA [Spirochaetota bacterium]|nr:excinuclease ABC subunit UvrA [Spirochaetota bacterium]